MDLRRTLDRHPNIKAGLKRLLRPFRSTVSSDYLPVASGDISQVASSLASSWQDARMPARQRLGVEQSLAAYRRGEPIKDFDVLVDVLRPLQGLSNRSSLLEIGCSSGYYHEALALRHIDVDYRGCDYSEAFIALARCLYPHTSFDVGDATALGYAEASFDIVVSGCCLLHIPDYPRAIAETARVTRRWAVFHRTPVLHLQPTRTFTKRAYGVTTIELHFSEHELVERFASAGLRLVDVRTISADWRDGDAFAMKTYVCEKVV